MYPGKRPRQEVLRARAETKTKKKSSDFYMTPEGQSELQTLANKQPPMTPSTISYAKGCLSVASGPVDNDGWVLLELTADSGACDSVMPRSGVCESMKVWPSLQSERGFSYEVANGAEIPCLGERRLAIWTEGASDFRAMSIQVADVHKPLPSLSRCADVGYESRFGKS